MISEQQALAVMPAQGFVRHYVEYAMYLTDAPAAFHLGTAVALLSTLIPPELSFRYGGKNYGVNYVMLVGASGDARKSAAMSIGTDLLRQAGGVFMRDPQSEKGLLLELAAEPQQLLVYSELGSFLKGTQQGSHKDTLRMKLIDLWDCTPQTYKAGGTQIEIEAPRMSLLGGVAPHLLMSSTTEEDWSSGFLNRWIILTAKRERLLSPPPIQGWPDREKALVEYLRGLQARPIGPCIAWHADALDWWREWDKAILKTYASAVGESRSGFLSRTSSIALRIAMAYSIDFGEASRAGGGAWSLGLDVLIPACQLAELHLRSAIYIMENSMLSAAAREQRAVLDAVGDDALTLGGILRRVRPKMDKKQVIRIVDTLVEAQAIFAYQIDGAAHRWSRHPPEVDLVTGAVRPAVPRHEPEPEGEY